MRRVLSRRQARTAAEFETILRPLRSRVQAKRREEHPAVLPPEHDEARSDRLRPLGELNDRVPANREEFWLDRDLVKNWVETGGRVGGFPRNL
jgi:hypothetical protein